MTNQHKAGMPVEQGNRLIAEFMDFDMEANKKWGAIEDGPGYHSSFDWLMPVVEKIETLKGEDGRGEVEYVVTIEQTQCIISLGGEGEIVYEQAFDTGATKIQIVWQAVVQFIQFYNTQTPTT